MNPLLEGTEEPSHAVRFLLGTIALEPFRWCELAPLVRVSDWSARAKEAGFEGFELWQRHWLEAPQSERDMIQKFWPATDIFSTYLRFDDAPGAAAQREAVAEAIVASRSKAVKFNLGTDRLLSETYLRRFGEWSLGLPGQVRLLNECHIGDIADTPASAVEILARLDEGLGTDRVGIIVHAFLEPVAVLEDWLKRLGPRVRHIHVQHRAEDGIWRRLDRDAGRNKDRCRMLIDHGFSGTATVEFTDGTRWNGGKPWPDERPEEMFVAACSDLAFLQAHLR